MISHRYGPLGVCVEVWHWADTASQVLDTCGFYERIKEYLSLKIIVSPLRLVMASSDKAGSHLSGVLGCLGLGSSSPGPVIMK